jgi:hypothetical protein
MANIEQTKLKRADAHSVAMPAGALLFRGCLSHVSAWFIIVEAEHATQLWERTAQKAGTWSSAEELPEDKS